jgi:hypothetical protein
MGRRVAGRSRGRIWGCFSRIGSLFAHRRESTIVLSKHRMKAPSLFSCFGRCTSDTRSDHSGVSTSESASPGRQARQAVHVVDIPLDEAESRRSRQHGQRVVHLYLYVRQPEAGLDSIANDIVSHINAERPPQPRASEERDVLRMQMEEWQQFSRSERRAQVTPRVADRHSDPFFLPSVRGKPHTIRHVCCVAAHLAPFFGSPPDPAGRPDDQRV